MLPLLNPFNIILSAVLLLYWLSEAIKFIKRKRGYTLIRFVVSTVIWGGSAIVALYPSIPAQLSELLNIGENLNTLIFIGFLVVFALIYRQLRIIEKVDKSITDLTRELALKDIESLKRNEESQD